MKRVVIAILLMLSTSAAFGQRAVVSADALKWATLTPNIGVEVLLNERLTLELETTINPFSEVIPSFSTKQVSLSPELRYWFKRPLYSHYVGVNLLGSIYDLRLGDERNVGRLAALGLVYGYSFYLAPRWVLTPSIGAGVGVVSSSDLATSPTYSTKVKPMITKFGVSFSYIID